MGTGRRIGMRTERGIGKSTGMEIGRSTGRRAKSATEQGRSDCLGCPVVVTLLYIIHIILRLIPLLILTPMVYVYK